VGLTFKKSLLVLLLSIAFIGQGLSATMMSYQMMSYQMMSHQQIDASVMKPAMLSDSKMMSEHCLTLKKKSPVNQPPVNHSSINHSPANESDVDSNSNCCEQQCDCLFTSCTSTMDLVAFMHAEPIVLYSTKISFSLSPLLCRQINSPYRPPITYFIS
jgi:hypothetical protein